MCNIIAFVTTFGFVLSVIRTLSIIKSIYDILVFAGLFR